MEPVWQMCPELYSNLVFHTVCMELWWQIKGAGKWSMTWDFFHHMGKGSVVLLVPSNRVDLRSDTRPPLMGHALPSTCNISDFGSIEERTKRSDRLEWNMKVNWTNKHWGKAKWLKMKCFPFCRKGMEAKGGGEATGERRWRHWDGVGRGAGSSYGGRPGGLSWSVNPISGQMTLFAASCGIAEG